MNAGWTRERICELASGNYVTIRDADSRPMAVPEWLLAVGEYGESASWSGDVTAIHPSDRAAVIRQWWHALERPGELVVVDYRSRKDTGIHRQRSVMVNLTDEWLGGVLVVTEDLEIVATEEDWRVADDHSDAPAWTVGYLDEFSTIQRYEGRIEEIYGRPAADLVGKPALDFVDAEHQDEMIAAWLEVYGDPTVSRTRRWQVVTGDGSRTWVETTIINRLMDPLVSSMITVTHDVSQQLANEAELHRSREEFKTLAQYVPAPVFRSEGDGRLTFANDRWFEILGGHLPLCERLQDALHTDDRAGVCAALALLSSPFGPDSNALEVRGVSGDRTYQMTLRAVGAPGGDAQRSILGSLHDITSATALRHRAEHDALTGLLNRSATDEAIFEALAAGDTTVLAFVDLDGFKEVNDNEGHDTGDLVLREVGDRLRQAVRPGDEVGRYGGDEFVLICRDATTGAESVIEQRIQLVLTSPVSWDTGSWQPKASIGLTRVRPGDDVASVLRRADQAMYLVKRRHQRELKTTAPVVIGHGERQD